MQTHRFAALTLALLTLNGCQYVSYFHPSSVEFSKRFRTSPDTICEAMGARPGDSSLDWCIMRMQETWAARAEMPVYNENTCTRVINDDYAQRLNPNELFGNPSFEEASLHYYIQ